jgi:hypothetical protein
MKEIVFQDLTKRQQNKRSLSIYETFLTDGYKYTAERKTIFRLKEAYGISDQRTAKKLLRMNDVAENKNFSVLRSYDKRTSRRFWQSKLSGNLYVYADSILLVFAFIQVVRLEVVEVTPKAGGWSA